MNARNVLVLAMFGALALSACGQFGHEPAAGGDHGVVTAAEYERGPHRGRMLRDGDFALELQIFESGVPPEFHVYLYRNNKPLPPDAAQVVVELIRLGNLVDRFEFTPQNDYLLGAGVVTEPHSFEVVVKASVDGENHEWRFDSFEGRTTIATAVAQEAGIRTEVAGPAVIADTVTLNGRIVPDAGRITKLGARYAGQIDSVSVELGQAVAAGAELARITSNDSLRSYTVTAPMAGTVIALNANVGQQTGSEALFVIADYSRVWAELLLFPKDLQRVRVGQSARLEAADGDFDVEVTIGQLLPATTGTAVYLARAEIDNAERSWHPGQFLTGQVKVRQAEVPLAVKRSGLQGFRDFTVVFALVDETYEVRMLDLGRQDDTWVEVRSGLEPGTRYVTQNSFLLKVDVEKDAASHDH